MRECKTNKIFLSHVRIAARCNGIKIDYDLHAMDMENGEKGRDLL